MAVYILQPKLRSFNYSFSSISQPVLSPLQQLHLYNSQYPRNDLPEQPLPIPPLVQTHPYSFLGSMFTFPYALGRRRGVTQLCKGSRYRHSHGWKEGNHCICTQLEQAALAHAADAASWGRAPYSMQATGTVSEDATLAPQRIRQYLSSPIAVNCYWQSPRLCSAEVSV